MDKCKVTIFGCEGELVFKTDTYRSAYDGACDFLTELLCVGYMGAINDIPYVMDYQLNTAVPKP